MPAKSDKSLAVGRPTLFSESIAAEICRRIAEGEPLTRICADTCMPGYSTVLSWRVSNPGFASLYAKAREDQADTYADQMLEIADKATRGEIDVNAARLAVDARKWIASKLKPRAYGDRVGIEHSGSVAATPELRAVDYAPQWLMQRLAERQAARLVAGTAPTDKAGEAPKQ